MAKRSQAARGDLITLEDFKLLCSEGLLHDHQGFGHPVTDGKVDESVLVHPSRRDQIPPTATHILWIES
jgi:hypothetical protein